MVSIKTIVKLWHKTQIGNMHKCREKQLEFADMMWELWDGMAGTVHSGTVEDSGAPEENPGS